MNTFETPEVIEEGPETLGYMDKARKAVEEAESVADAEMVRSPEVTWLTSFNNAMGPVFTNIGIGKIKKEIDDFRADEILGKLQKLKQEVGVHISVDPNKRIPSDMIKQRLLRKLKEALE
ncbi:MAG: hypothetical protein V4526_02845 [Patescibacteria group bacterium]